MDEAKGKRGPPRSIAKFSRQGAVMGDPVVRMQPSCASRNGTESRKSSLRTSTSKDVHASGIAIDFMTDFEARSWFGCSDIFLLCHLLL